MEKITKQNKMKMLRIASIHALKSYYSKYYAEDSQNGTNFDNDVLDGLDIILENYDEKRYSDYNSCS